MLFGALGIGAFGLVLGQLWFWGVEEARVISGQDRKLLLITLESSDPEEVAQRLSKEGLIDDVDSFSWYQRIYLRSATFETGPHLVPVGVSPRELVQLLARHRSRPARKVTVPEGFDSFQIAARLEKLGICPREAFLAAAFEPTLARAEIGASSFEGYLYPSTYEFRLNSNALDVRRRMTQEAVRRYDEVLEAQPEAVAKWNRDLGFGRPELVTLASVVQKETAVVEEAGTVASVFLNRLSDKNFRPLGALQSDPTAGYGCKLPDAPKSCEGFTGRITPALLRDPQNRYNTYKHENLPPGPVSNPSAQFLERVLLAPKTEFYYFVAGANGRHVFSRTFGEHRSAISGGGKTGNSP